MIRLIRNVGLALAGLAMPVVALAQTAAKAPAAPVKQTWAKGLQLHTGTQLPKRMVYSCVDHVGLQCPRIRAHARARTVGCRLARPRELS